MSFDYARVSRPDFFSENRLSAHSDHRWYRSGEEAGAGRSSFIHSLNGLWKFHYAKNIAAAVPGFERPEYACGSWDDIRVPSHIQYEGYDAPQYCNIQNPWDGLEPIHPGEIPASFNPVASYVKTFLLPAALLGDKSVAVSFQGVEASFALWLNGHYIGYASDSMTPAEFDLTPYLDRGGVNKLAAQVYKFSGSSWIQDQDMFRFSGIFRDVYLFGTPAVHVRDMAVKAKLDDLYADGLFSLALSATGAGKAVVMLGRAGCKLWHGEAEMTADGAASLSATIPSVARWSAEAPELYDLRVEIYDGAGALMEVIEERVGFRRFEMKDGLMRLNGKRIWFAGTNRHEFSAAHGRAVTEEETRLDLLTMKANNINAVRTCHYPNNSWLYRMCDEYGLYVIDEANIESHAVWDYSRRSGTFPEALVPGDKPEWRENVLDRANNMLQRDKNHACVLIWSCGNESAGGKNFSQMSELFRRLDDTRLVHYESIFEDMRYPDTSDMWSNMYLPAEKLEEYLREHPGKPLISCEYVHTMGNSGGAMFEYIDLGAREPRFQGGFIWDYIDQAVYTRDRFGKEFAAYGGDFGDRPNDFEFSGDGIVYGDHTPSPKMQEVKYLYQSVFIAPGNGKAVFDNRSLFTRTGEWDCEIAIHREGALVRKARMDTDVPPLSKQELKLPVWPDAGDLPGEYTVTVSLLQREDTPWAKAGYEVCFGQTAVMVKAKTPELRVATPPPVLIHGYHNIGVRGEHFSVLFSLIKGGLHSYRYAGRELLEAFPKPNFWRAPNSNDMGNDMPARYGQWKLASEYLMNTGPNPRPGDLPPTVEQDGDSVTVTWSYGLPTSVKASCSLGWRVTGDGTITGILTYDPVPALGDMPVFGVMVKLSADYGHVEWYGNGPEETYSDRKHGAKLGVYRGTVAEQMAKYLVPQETGNKTGVRWARVTDRQGRGMLFTAPEGQPMEFSALPHTPFELENAAHPTELPPAHYTVVRANLMQMGVAGDDSWGARTHPAFLVPTDKPLRFQFSMKGL